MKTVRHLLATLVAIAILATTITASTVAETTPTIKNNNDSTVTVKYDYNYSNRVKVLVVAPSKKQYQYELNTGKNNVVLPLTEGTGTYTIKVCKNTTGKKYAVISTTTVNNKKEYAYLNTNTIVNYTTDEETIKLAAELTKDCTTDLEKINAIRDYMVANYKYDYNKINTIAANTTYVPELAKTLEAKTGICYDFSQMVAAMLRSVDVPCKLVKGYSTKATTYHAWNQVYVDGEWKTMDVTYDLQISNTNTFKNVNDYNDIRYQY